MSQAQEIVTVDQTDDEKEASGNLVPLPTRIMKKILGGDDVAGIQQSNLLELSEQMLASFGQVGALEPLLEPLALSRLVSMSSTLRPLIDAMSANIHGFGYRFEPVIDLDASDALDRVRAAMQLEAEQKAEDEASDGDDPADIDAPTDEEVKERIDSLREQMRREKAKLESFFSNVSRKYSFTRLSRKMQNDKEGTGYGVWEVRRDGTGKISLHDQSTELLHVDAQLIRAQRDLVCRNGEQRTAAKVDYIVQSV